jgi:hypothetical protein
MHQRSARSGGMGIPVGAALSAVRDDGAMRIRRAQMIAARGVVLGCLAVAAASCASGAEGEEPPSSPVVAVRDAAVRTRAAGPANIEIEVSSATTEYSVRGAIELATDRFRARARVERAPMTLHDKDVELIGVGGETYEIGRGAPGFDNITPTACGVDPHAPIGSLGGAASIQEALALVGVAVRLLRDGTGTAELVGEHTYRGATYRVVADPSAVSVAPVVRRGDEVIVVDPQRLARHLAPTRVTVNSGGLVSRLSLELRRFPPPSHGPGLARQRPRERVSITVSLGDFGRELEVRPPSCIAME